MPNTIPTFVAQPFCVIEPANYYTPVWVPVERNWLRTSECYEPGPSAGYTWWNFTAIQIGQIFFPGPRPLDQEVANELCDAALSNPDPNSLFRVELEYALGNGVVRQIRFDIGSGIDLVVPPTFNIRAKLLRPEPQEGAAVPTGFNPDLWVAARLVLQAVCVTDPHGSPTNLTWSTPVFLQDPDVLQVDIPIEDGAVEVSACFDAPPANNLQFIYQRRSITGAIIDETVISEVAPEAPPSTCFPRTPIPHPANIIRYFEVNAGGLSGTIVQHLELS